ncbi:hypothetical protein L7F22_064404 [Adiantum nelumboides]|nr:hypothetical protein [Adiantum nelumboides]
MNVPCIALGKHLLTALATLFALLSPPLSATAGRSRFVLPDLDTPRSQRPLSLLPTLPGSVWPDFREAPSFRNGKECIPSELYYSGYKEEESLCDSLAIHVAMTLDATYIRGSVAAIFSIVQHSVCPENVVFHFLASDSKAELAQIIRLTFPYLKFKVYHFDVSLVKDKISASIRAALEQPLNYARSYLAEILPSCVKRVIYLDSDVVLIDDISRLWATNLDGHPLGAPEYCHANFTLYFTDAFWTDATLSAVFEGRNPCYFNTGVMVMDLDMWRFWGYTKAIEDWMEVQKSVRIYELGSLPPFLLVFAGDVQPIEHQWNQHGLGGDNFEGLCRTLHPGPVSLLHWSGKGKPWVRLGSGRPCALDSLWAPYDLVSDSNFLQS